MKRIVVALLIGTISIFLVGCFSVSTSTDDLNAKKLCSFERIYKDVNVGIGSRDDIFVDRTTGVIYIRNWNHGLSPIYNSDGTLKNWKESK